MTRGLEVRRGVVVLSLVVAGAAGCAASRPAAHAAPPASRPLAALATSRPAAAPALRLITCAGTFDRARHSYRDNLVVSAVRVADGGGRAEAGR
jgi:hypothetical protein